jgi:type IV conjugative transfer system protein TraL
MLMSDPMFNFLRYLDEPKRIMGLTMDDCIIGGLGIFLAVVGRHPILIGLLSFGIRTIVKRLKKGQTPNYLIELMYWYLPHQISRIFLKSLPASYKRYWMS